MVRYINIPPHRQCLKRYGQCSVAAQSRLFVVAMHCLTLRFCCSFQKHLHKNTAIYDKAFPKYHALTRSVKLLYKVTDRKKLNILLIAHAIVTLAAGILLIIAPTIIPNAVDVHISSDQYILCYFLGAAELSIAYLSFSAKKIDDQYSLRVIAATFIVFHAATTILEIYELLQGVGVQIIGNIILRLVVIGLFYYYGIHKNKIKQRIKP